jgi:acyl-CoA synthetase (AMP-forming)/AMP-acid ligase II
MNLMMLLEMAASGFPDRVALTCGDQSLTYGELFAAAGAAGRRAARVRGDARGRARRVEPGAAGGAVRERVGGRAVRAAQLPAHRRGARPLIEQITPCHLVTDAERAAQLGSRAGVTASSREDYLARVRGSASARPSGTWIPRRSRSSCSRAARPARRRPPCCVTSTSVSYILSSVEFGSAAEDAAGLVCVPALSHRGHGAIASSIYSGRRIVQLASFDADAWIDLVARERVTNAFVVPTMLARITEALEERGGVDLPSLAALSYGGGKMPLPVIERAMKLFPPTTDFTNAYGLTETSSTLTVLGPDDHRAAAASADPEVRRRLASVGARCRASRSRSATRTARRSGPACAARSSVRGEQVSGEYLGKGTRVGGDGFFPTRDGGWLDSDGYLFLEGRIDDIIVRGGENMSPGEIEEVLLEHDAVADCAVVGVPDEQWGEAVAAAIVTAPGQE